MGFIEDISPYAQRVSKESNVLASIIIAQAILESNWGRSELSKANNLFGMKGSYNNQSVVIKTVEYKKVGLKEVPYQIEANFRKYPSYYESFHDLADKYVNGVSWDKDKYRKVVGERDYKVAAKAIKDAGYASDPEYPNKLIKIIEDYKLTQYDNLKEENIMTDITKACRDINELSSVAKKACTLFLSECKKAGIDIFITETYRSQARQNYLYEQGRTRSGQKVTWTKSSNHTGRMAWDIAVNPPKNLYDEATLKKAGAIAKKLGIEWGGTWDKANLDMPHFEVDKNWKAPGATTASKTTAKTNTTSSPSSTSSKKADSTITSIQKKMNSRYETSIESDGFYGKSTKGALIKGFQSELNKQYKAKLKVDGIWGKNTREKSPVITKNAEGNIIYILQAALYCNGCDPKGVDGKFGSGTQSAVKLFQKANGLTQDGIVGLKTWEALFK